MQKRMCKMSEVEHEIAEELGINIEYVYRATTYPPKAPEFMRTS